MRSSTAQVSLFVVAMLVGLLLVGQLRSQARPTELSSLTAQELSELIETLSVANRELRAGLIDARDTLREYEDAGVAGESAMSVTQEDLRRITAWGGLAPVEGQGIEIEIAGDLDAIALNDLIYELRNAGAEAIAVDEVRITHRSVAVQGPMSLVIDGVEIGDRFVLRAIGSPDGLRSAIERPGGIVAQLQQFIQASIVVRSSAELTLPATSLPLAPSLARSVE